ncbi:MYG1 family protein [Oceanisphaera pacifica]|uniref:MYG1 family protein n=1 Tax=Oceanisphaera pacifica TaxID=2818389 RepID=A0ABS3NDP8_9GAMM|nr:MYG1 family protein [Oceanisphaera pacifica]MBO1518675.1 MYG1 family protein [Oceanisphaera pacifica]
MKKIIVTHSGKFHADDVFSVATLMHLYPDAQLIRTRDAAIIATGDIVVDVGQEYDANRGRFDHHQRGGAGARDNGIPYSSFGLVWRHYGLAVCQENSALADKLDANLVSVIDAIDCGYAISGDDHGVSLSQTIGLLNPTWQEADNFDDCFLQAVQFASTILMRFIASARAQLDAYQEVVTAITQAEDPNIVVLDKYIPWKQAVHDHALQALYIVYPSPSMQWMIQAVPVSPDSFENKKSLPVAWAGLSGAELQQATGINDAGFCHNNRFIAGAASFTSAIAMAKLAKES